MKLYTLLFLFLGIGQVNGQCATPSLARTFERLPRTDAGSYTQQENPRNAAYVTCPYVVGGITATYPLSWFSVEPNVRASIEYTDLSDPNAQYFSSISINSAGQTTVRVNVLPPPSCSDEGVCIGSFCTGAPTCGGTCTQRCSQSTCTETCGLGTCNSSCADCPGDECASICNNCAGECNGSCSNCLGQCTSGFSYCSGSCAGVCNSCVGTCDGDLVGNTCNGYCSQCVYVCNGICSQINPAFGVPCLGTCDDCQGSCNGGCVTCDGDCSGTCRSNTQCTSCTQQCLGETVCNGPFRGTCTECNGQCQGECANCDPADCTGTITGSQCVGTCTTCSGECNGGCDNCTGLSDGFCIYTTPGVCNGFCYGCEGTCSGTGFCAGGLCVHGCTGNSLAREATNGEVVVHLYALEE